MLITLLVTRFSSILLHLTYIQGNQSLSWVRGGHRLTLLSTPEVAAVVMMSGPDTVCV